jgi:hypothetical protein
MELAIHRAEVGILKGGYMKVRHLVLAVSCALTLVACSDNNSKTVDFKSENLRAENVAAQGLQVVNVNGDPVAFADVLIGPEPNVPFKGNMVKTDANGMIPDVPAWTKAESVTVESADFVRTTFLNVTPSARQLQLHTADSPNLFEVKGKTDGFGRLRRDGNVDFGLVIPAMTKENLIGFDLTDIISPEVDTIRVAIRDVDLPSNLTLPKQRETYIVPITFNKPAYRSYLKRKGFTRMVAAHGRFPLKKVVDAFQDEKPIFDIVNEFEFIQSGAIDFDIEKNVAGKDIKVDQLKFDAKTSIQAPNFSSSSVMLSLALVDQSGYLTPSDLKKVDPGKSAELKIPSQNADNYILSVLSPSADLTLREGEDRKISSNGQDESKFGQLSLVLQDSTPGQTPNFIPLVDEPTIQGNVITLTSPTSPAGIEPIGTYIVLSEVTSVPNSSFNSEIKVRLWELFSPEWEDQIELPKVTINRDPAKKYRWEVLYLGKGQNKVNGGNANGTYQLNDVTHVSRNAVTL